MTDESTPEALETVATNVTEDVKKDAPTVEAHLESFGEWTVEELEKAYQWIKSKL